MSKCLLKHFCNIKFHDLARMANNLELRYNFGIASTPAFGNAIAIMADWFYGKDNAQHGPVSDLEVRNLISTGQITQDTIIWREGMTDWLPMKDVPDFQTSQVANQGRANFFL